MPYQKRLKKTYGAIESQAQSVGPSNNIDGDGGFGSTKQNPSNNNNNVSYQKCVNKL